MILQLYFILNYLEFFAILYTALSAPIVQRERQDANNYLNK